MLLLLVFCLMVMIFPVSSWLDILHFVSSLGGGNLFAGWVTAVASLQNESDWWVYSEIPLLSSSGIP